MLTLYKATDIFTKPPTSNEEYLKCQKYTTAMNTMYIDITTMDIISFHC